MLSPKKAVICSFQAECIPSEESLYPGQSSLRFLLIYYLMVCVLDMVMTFEKYQ